MPGRRRYDLVVIGGGTAGLVSSAIAAELGARVLLVERSLLGGDCLVAGCVPSKALIRCARAAASVREVARFGIHGVGEPRVDFPEVMRRLREKRARIAHHDSVRAFEGRGVEVVFGEARFTGRRSVEINGTSVEFVRAILATGSRPRRPAIEGLGEEDYLTNETVFGLEELPERLAVIGGGPLGCELAQAFARLGSTVTLIEKSERVMGPEDADAAELLARSMSADGVRVLTGGEARRVEHEDGRKVLLVGEGSSEQRIVATHVLAGVGREAITEGLDLDRAGIETRRHGVVVNDRLRTSNRRVYAAGDCCLKAKFTHTADASARIAVRNALFFGWNKSSGMIIPRCTYTSPEIASVGDPGDADGTSTVKIELGDVDRAIVDGAEEGWLKVTYRERSGKIVGAVLVGDHAGDMISIVTATMKLEGTLKDLSETIFPYPTVGEVARMAGDEYQLRSLGSVMRGGARVALKIHRMLG